MKLAERADDMEITRGTIRSIPTFVMTALAMRMDYEQKHTKVTKG